MSRLWAFTLIILALGLGLIAGVLVVMFVFVLPRARHEESAFAQTFKFASLLQAASPKDTQWDIMENGTTFYAIGAHSSTGRRYLAECKMPSANGLTTFPNLFQNEVQKSMNPHGGMIYNVGGTSRVGSTTSNGISPPPTSSPGGAVPPLPEGGTAPQTQAYVRHQTTMPFAVGQHTGCVHITVIGDGEKLFVSVIVHEQ